MATVHSAVINRDNVILALLRSLFIKLEYHSTQVTEMAINKFYILFESQMSALTALSLLQDERGSLRNISLGRKT